MLELRKLVAWREQVFAEMGHTAPVPVVRAVGLAVIANPYAGRRVADLSLLFGLGAAILEATRRARR